MHSLLTILRICQPDHHRSIFTSASGDDVTIQSHAHGAYGIAVCGIEDVQLRGRAAIEDVHVSTFRAYPDLKKESTLVYFIIKRFCV